MRTKVTLLLVAVGAAVAPFMGAAAARGGHGDPSVDERTLKMGTPITYEQFKEPFPEAVPSKPNAEVSATGVIGEYSSGWVRP